MFIVGFPWLDRRTDTVEWGIACNGCKHKHKRTEDSHHKKGPRLDRVLYSKQDFFDHLYKCEELANLFVKDHNKFDDDEKIWKQMNISYCHVAGDAKSVREQEADEPLSSQSSGCFLWHGKESMG
jgi:hypothetical protein